MAYDAHVNLAYATVATAPSPATSGTSLVINSPAMPFPAAPFDLTLWPAGVALLPTNAEIVRVTSGAGTSGSPYVITRGLYGSTARSIAAGWQCINGATAKSFQDIETAVTPVVNRVLYLDAFGADPTGATSSDTAFDNMLTAAAALVTAGRTVMMEMGHGTYLTSGGHFKTTDRRIGLRGQGLGATIVKAASGATGTLVTLTDTTASGSAAVACESFSVNMAAAAANTVAVQYGDRTASKLHCAIYGGVAGGTQLLVQNSSGTSAGTEGTDCNVHLLASTGRYGVHFSGNAGTGWSHDYSDWVFHHVGNSASGAAVTNGAAYSAVMVDSAAELDGVRFVLRGNIGNASGSTTAMIQIGDSATDNGCNIHGTFDIEMECDAGNVDDFLITGENYVAAIYGIGTIQLLNAGGTFVSQGYDSAAIIFEFYGNCGPYMLPPFFASNAGTLFQISDFLIYSNSGGRALTSTVPGLFHNVAATAAAGYSKINGTGTILSYTVPNDGNLHAVQLYVIQKVTTAETGGAIQFHCTYPDGTSYSPTVYPGTSATGITTQSAVGVGNTVLVEPNTTVTLSQTSALTAGASKVYAKILSD